MANYFYDSFTETSDTNMADHTPDTDPGSVGWTQILYTTIVKASIDAAVHESGTAFQVAPIRRGSLPSSDGLAYINVKLGDTGTGYRAYIGLTDSDRDGYFAVLRGDGRLILYATTAGGTTTQLGLYTIPSFSASTTYKVSIRCLGTSIKAFLDDVERISETNSTNETRDGVLIQIYNTPTGSSVEVYDVGYEKIENNGDLDVTLDSITLSATGTQAETGDLDATLDSIVLSATGSNNVPPEGDLDVILDSIGLSATGIQSNLGDLDVTLDSIGLTATGSISSIFEKINWTGGENDSSPSTEPTFEIMRLTDNYFLDFNDMTFKASGWTTKSVTLAEEFSSPLPTFQYELETSAFDGYYYFIPYSPDTFNKPSAFQEAYSDGVRITGGLTFSELSTLNLINTKLGTPTPNITSDLSDISDDISELLTEDDFLANNKKKC